MRIELQSLEGRKVQFIATFVKYGTYRSNGVAGRSILLQNLKTVSGQLLSDHIWINYTAGFDAIGELLRGDKVRFTAIVKTYLKGYFGHNIDDRLKRETGLDYRLAFPRNVEIVAEAGQENSEMIFDDRRTVNRLGRTFHNGGICRKVRGNV